MAKYGPTKTGDPKTKTGKYIVYCTHPNPFHPPEAEDQFHMYLDGRGIEGGFYCSGTVVHEASPAEDIGWKPHRHDNIEYITLWGTNPDDPSDLGGEVEFYIEDDKHVVTKTCVICVPPGVSHCPFHFNRVDRPIFFLTMSSAPVLTEHTNRDPQWAHLPDPPNIEEVLD